MQLESPDLNPTAGAAATIDAVIHANLFRELIRFGPDGALEPDLARRWETSQDGLTWTFVLQPDVTFQGKSPFSTASNSPGNFASSISR